MTYSSYRNFCSERLVFSPSGERSIVNKCLSKAGCALFISFLHQSTCSSKSIYGIYMNLWHTTSEAKSASLVKHTSTMGKKSMSLWCMNSWELRGIPTRVPWKCETPGRSHYKKLVATWKCSRCHSMCPIKMNEDFRRYSWQMTQYVITWYNLLVFNIIITRVGYCRYVLFLFVSTHKTLIM